ncbi:hypothetical protein Pst134EA_015886 [Puccinia striiformis f. sp. tritici]|uniref:hypothetical protein n=1 Tax=Puccinia striiformis f. sp. tritici TaxID=168172 RepID=UPI002007C43A|nr:hypothetical protein Pst134EA_015886 [Puccinia striiformis f. sp. tritici]KAH9463805.1 hypothetical protein Pst134EA_015886 [Puccinia striiformis f. sp. tritici]
MTFFSLNKGFIVSCFTLCFFCSVAFTSASGFQKIGLKQSPLAKSRQDEVKRVFASAFADYMKFGYPYDEVRPVSKTGSNTRNGWSATLVDSLDTLFVMGLRDEFEKGILNTLKIDFTTSQTKDTVSLFETTIRYLGGMLSAYELSGSSNKPLLNQARTLGDKLLIAWPDSQQNLPFPTLDFGRNMSVFGKDASTAEVLTAEAGTLILELERLSYHTRDPKYLRHAAKAMQAIMSTPSTFPGLAGFSLAVKSQAVKNDKATWGGGADSYYEYLLKYGIISQNRDKSYLKTWKLAVESSKQHLLQVSPLHNLTYLASFSSSKGGIDYEFSHLGCFAGGNWLLGGKVLNDPSTFEYGLRLIETCMETYKRTATGLGPESFRFLGPHDETAAKKPSSEDLAFFKKNGFYIDSRSYILRPEVVESAFYAWRLTGDTRYQDFVWDAFQSLQKHCKASASFSAIADVNSLPAKFTDDSESFLYAELFKYFYLTFSDPNLLSLDEYVFTTEAHPFRIMKGGV